MDTVSFDVSPHDWALILQCVARAKRLYLKNSVALDVLDLNMDLCATHANGCPMDFRKLLDAPDFDFLHDIAGIRRHMNRETGQLENAFLPRCHLQEPNAD